MARWWVIGLAGLIASCRAPQPVARPAPPPPLVAKPAPLRLVVFLADGESSKRREMAAVAAALNRSLAAIFPASEVVKVASVPIGDARALVDECTGVEPAPCWRALGEQNHAERLVIPEVTADRKRRVNVALRLIDVAHEKVARAVDRWFPTGREAQAGIAALVGELAAPPAASSPAMPATEESDD